MSAVSSKLVGTRIEDLLLTLMEIHAFLLGMYVRSIKRKNKDGSEVEYIKLAHDTRHPEKGYTPACPAGRCTTPGLIASAPMLCFAGWLCLVRVTELETGMTWPRARAELERLHLGEFLHKDGRILQYTEPTLAQRKTLKKLKISIPKRGNSFTGIP